MTLPRPIPLLLAALGAVVLVSTAVGIYLTFTQTPPAWFFFSFEVVVVLGGVFLVLLGLGKVKEGPAMTLLCCAGAIGAGSLLGWKGTGQQINGQSVTWLVVLRGLIAGVLVLAAAAELLVRDPKRTLPRIGWGVATGAPLLAMVALYANGVIPTAIGGVGVSSPALAFGLWMMLGLIACVLASASGHMFITGFAMGVAAWDRKPGTPPPAPTSSAKPSARPATATAPTNTPSGTQG